MMRIMAIGVHPDDIEFGMGGTLAKHIKLGHEVSIVVLTDGERDDKGKYIESINRRNESKSALKILGYKGEPMFLNSNKVTSGQYTIKILEAKIKEFMPTRIYTHSRNDRHQDHRNCSYATLSAARYVNEILLYEIYSVFPEFNPNYIVNFSKKLLDLKIKALSEFKSQFLHQELIAKMIEGMAIKSGFINYATQSKEIHYSESFEIAKIVRNKESI